MYRCTSQACRWVGHDDEVVAEWDEAETVLDVPCPQCGGECVPMDDQEVQNWEHWQRQISQAHSELIRDWRQQRKPRGKRPTRDEAEQRLRSHITH
jgi:hypothetical protein